MQSIPVIERLDLDGVSIYWEEPGRPDAPGLPGGAVHVNFLLMRMAGPPRHLPKPAAIIHALAAAAEKFKKCHGRGNGLSHGHVLLINAASAWSGKP